jgi:hypothetical protein
MNDINLNKKFLIIDTIYHFINIKKAIIVINNYNNIIISILKHYDHDVCTINSFQSFLENKKRLLLLTTNELDKYYFFLENDKYIDTIFFINESSLKYINQFKHKSVIIYEI